MVLDIRYSEYNRFCSLLPCKDIFYYIDDLFICFKEKPNKILCIKGKKYKYVSNNDNMYKYYMKLEKSGKLQRLTLSDFLNGTTHREGCCHINQDFYTSKSFLVVV